MVRMATVTPRALWKHVAVYGLLMAIVLYPIAIVTVPSLEDYPKHLARMYILTHYNESASLQQYYDVRWRPIPYLAMDSVFLLLASIANTYDAGRLFVGLCVLLPVLSVAALHFAVHRRLSLVPAGAFLLSYNTLLLLGFLNYLPVLCLAVIVFAGWITTIKWPRWPRLVLFSALTLVLYLGHVVALRWLWPHGSLLRSGSCIEGRSSLAGHHDGLGVRRLAGDARYNSGVERKN